MPKRFPEKEFNEIYSKVPRLCVDLVIKNSKGDFLLTFRTTDPKDLWHLPGGTIFFNENIEEAAKRIAKEELNAEIEILDNIGFIQYPNYIGVGHPVSIVFEAKLLTPENKIKLDFQASEWKFFSKTPEKIFKEQKEFLDKLN